MASVFHVLAIELFLCLGIHHCESISDVTKNRSFRPEQHLNTYLAHFTLTHNTDSRHMPCISAHVRAQITSLATISTRNGPLRRGTLHHWQDGCRGHGHQEDRWDAQINMQEYAHVDGQTLGTQAHVQTVAPGTGLGVRTSSSGSSQGLGAHFQCYGPPRSLVLQTCSPQVSQNDA